MKLVSQAIAVALVLLAGMGAARADDPALGNATCLGCHGTPGFSIKLPSGETRALFVPPSHFADSVHGKFQCATCHTDITQIPHTTPLLSETQWREQGPKICGACHTAQMKNYLASTHGQMVMSGAGVGAAVCTDCHTTHAVTPPTLVATRRAITMACAGCHASQFAGYERTYHGQVFALGYSNIAMCANCHRGHLILPASDPASSVTRTNLRNMCLPCHHDAPIGFATITAHPDASDFARYPAAYIAERFMFWLVALTLGFFWLHCALWLYAELRDRFQRQMRPHVRAAALPSSGERRFLRHSVGWRWVHLLFALSVIVLVLTGIPLLYPNSAWAPVLVAMLGGETARGIIHRVAAVVMTVIFVGHIVYVAIHLTRNWKTVRLFGPYSLLPTVQDGRDFVAMMKWFAGAGPYPAFDHWNYQHKFDYWAPFWGVVVLAVSGAVLWFKDVSLAFLPGDIIDLSDIVHGHECVLAAAYLFTIHFFVNHWRPNKFPLDTSIFTGTVPLDEFRREYGAEYARLVASGELDQHLVQAPSPPMAIGSTVLGFTLIFVALALLILMFAGGFLNIAV